GGRYMVRAVSDMTTWGRERIAGGFERAARAGMGAGATGAVQEEFMTKAARVRSGIGSMVWDRSSHRYDSTRHFELDAPARQRCEELNSAHVRRCERFGFWS
ncbi:hypothetical protein AB0O47_40160, partial [Streptomyces noursei]|uniref:hypothetical protein n=1 Tax=Streptomyces noursei TaxID=1971 RepID=UPI00344B52CC